MTRLAQIAAASVLLLLLAAAQALAQAGGGSSGFSGGGGGGGGGSSGGSSGRARARARAMAGGGCSSSSYRRALLLHARRSAAAQARPRTPARRARRARDTASAEAAEDDPGFAADAVKTAAVDAVPRPAAGLERTRRRGTRGALGPDLLVEWRRRLADFERRAGSTRSGPAGPGSEYVGLVNREGRRGPRHGLRRRDAAQRRATARLDDLPRRGHRPGRRHRGLRVLDARALRRGLAPGLDRAGGGGRPPPRARSWPRRGPRCAPRRRVARRARQRRRPAARGRHH